MSRYIPRRRANLNLDLTCHACGHKFEQRVGWRVKYVYCLVCNSREVHTFEPKDKATGLGAKGVVVAVEFHPKLVPFLAVK